MIMLLKRRGREIGTRLVRLKTEWQDKDLVEGVQNARERMR